MVLVDELGCAAATRASENYLMAATETEDLDRAVAAAASSGYAEAYRRGAELSPAEAFGLLVRQ